LLGEPIITQKEEAAVAFKVTNRSLYNLGANSERGRILRVSFHISDNV